MVTIDELARRTGRSVETLRRLERLGKITKAMREPLTRRRMWSDEQAREIERLLGVKPASGGQLGAALEEAERFVLSEEGQAILRRVQGMLAGGRS